MSEENQFTFIVERLLSGQFICAYSDETSYNYLRKEAYFQNIDEYLKKIDRCLKSTSSQSAYYCAYTSIHASERRSDVKKQFRESIHSLEPLCRWLKLLMSALQRDASIQPGDIIRHGELLNTLEVTPALIDDLSGMTGSGLFATKRAAPKEQLNHILTTLQNLGYLVSPSTTSSIFTATGKWEYLYEVLEFIHTHETIGGDELPANQQELLL